MGLSFFDVKFFVFIRIRVRKVIKKISSNIRHFTNVTQQIPTVFVCHSLNII
jgi:hypothetical protein